MNVSSLAEQIREYIKRRAKVEGVGFELPLEVFQQCVEIGANAFGVSHDGQRMLSDEQEPLDGFFEETKSKIRIVADLN